MSVFAQIHEIVAQQPDQPEYWSEYGLQTSIQLAQHMTESDWACLRNSWMSASVIWQYRVANLASYCASDRAIPLLADMLRMSSDDVYVRVLESLGEFKPNEVMRHLSASDVNLMKQMSSSLAGLNKSAIDSVIRQLGV